MTEVTASRTAGEAGPALIQLEGIERVFGRGQSAVRAVDGIDLEVRTGEFLAVMGASGSGKSTCMNIIGCLDRPTAGKYRLAGIEVGGLDRDQLALLRRHAIGFIFQGFNLIARTTALENVELPLIYQRVPARERRARAMEVLAMVGLADRARHAPNELSGGQQQRVAVARALVGRPLVMLADEPTGNLDSRNGDAVMNLLSDLHAGGATICMVTHDPRYADHAERTVHLFDGRIVDESVASFEAATA